MQNIKNVCSQIKSHSNDAFKFLIELYDEEFKKSNKQEIGYLKLPLVVWKCQLIIAIHAGISKGII